MTPEEQAAADAKAKADTDAAAQAATAAATTQTQAAAQTQQQTQATQTAEDVASLPEWAQKLLSKTRTEAATNRTKEKTASEALEATRDAISKALGLKPEDDPVAAAKTAAERATKAELEAKATRIENAVLKAAAKHGANAESLTDSRSFMRTLEAIDSAADDFAAQVDAAIKAAVEANPTLKGAAPVPARSGGPAHGGTPLPNQLTRDELKTMTPEQIEEARVAGRLKTLLGQ